jgi:hypothetical protein
MYANPLSPTIMFTVTMYAPVERADTLSLFLLYLYMYSVDQPLMLYFTTFKYVNKH